MDQDGTPLSFVTPEGLHLSGVIWGGAGQDGQGGMDNARQIVFTPGNGFPVECYRPALAALAAEAEIHALNPRGLGSSEAPRTFESWEAPLADLEAYIRQAMRPPVVLAGHSFGAMLSLWLASKAPELTRGLMLLDPLVSLPGKVRGPQGGSTRERELIERTRNRRESWPSKEDAAEALRDRGGYEGWQAEAFDAFLDAGLEEAEDGGVRLACPAWLETRIYETFPKTGIWEWAESIQAPAVMLRGEDSDVAHPEALEALTEILPIAAVAAVKGGHTFAQQHPARAAEALDFAWRLILRAEPGEEITL